MPPDRQVNEGRGDVDRIDTLVGHGADVTRPHIADHPEFDCPLRSERIRRLC